MNRLLRGVLAALRPGEPVRERLWKLAGRVTDRVFPKNASGNNASTR